MINLHDIKKEEMTASKAYPVPGQHFPKLGIALIVAGIQMIREAAKHDIP
jgi:hypothetical protein